MSSSSSTLLGIIDNQNQCHQSVSSIKVISTVISVSSSASTLLNFISDIHRLCSQCHHQLCTRSQFSVITSKTFQNIQLLVSLELLDGEGVESLVYFWREVPFEGSVVCLRTQSFHEGRALVAG